MTQHPFRPAVTAVYKINCVHLPSENVGWNYDLQLLTTLISSFDGFLTSCVPQESILGALVLYLYASVGPHTVFHLYLYSTYIYLHFLVFNLLVKILHQILESGNVSNPEIRTISLARLLELYRISKRNS